MTEQETKLRLEKIVDTLRDYGLRLIDGLTPEDVDWTLKDTKGKSIKEIFRHIVEGELYWLNFIGKDTPQSLEELPTLEYRELLDLYLELQKLLKKLIKGSSSSDLIPKDPKEGAKSGCRVRNVQPQARCHLSLRKNIRETSLPSML